MSAVELGPAAAEVVCQAESLVAVEAGARAGVALVRRSREAGTGTTLAMIRLRGEGVAFLCAHRSAETVTLKSGEALEAAWLAVVWYEATADHRMLVVGDDGTLRGARAWMAGIMGPGRIIQGQREAMWGW